MNHPEATRERSLGLFVLGLVIFNPPILSLFSVDGFVLGVPVLYFYLFVAWVAFIAMLFVSARWIDAIRQRRDDAGAPRSMTGEMSPPAGRAAR
jgi:uncharacterized membrane protein YedE/YeeE